jgi:hypothetical protein
METTKHLQVEIINKSEAVLSISFEPAREALNAIDIELLPYNGLHLKPHSVTYQTPHT